MSNYTWKNSPLYDANIWRVIESFLPNGEKLHQKDYYTSTKLGNPLNDISHFKDRFCDLLQCSFKQTDLITIRWLIENYLEYLQSNTCKVYFYGDFCPGILKIFNADYITVPILEFFYVILYYESHRSLIAKLLCNKFDTSQLKETTFIVIFAIATNNYELVTKFIDKANYKLKYTPRIPKYNKNNKLTSLYYPICKNIGSCEVTTIIEFAILMSTINKCIFGNNPTKPTMVVINEFKLSNLSIFELLIEYFSEKLNETHPSILKTTSDILQDQPISFIPMEDEVTQVIDKFNFTKVVYYNFSVETIKYLTNHHVILHVQEYFSIHPTLVQEFFTKILSNKSKSTFAICEWLESCYPNLVNTLMSNDNLSKNIHRTILQRCNLEEIQKIESYTNNNLYTNLYYHSIDSILSNNDERLLYHFVSKEDFYPSKDTICAILKSAPLIKDYVRNSLNVLIGKYGKKYDNPYTNTRNIISNISRDNFESNLEYVETIVDDHTFNYILDLLCENLQESIETGKSLQSFTYTYLVFLYTKWPTKIPVIYSKPVEYILYFYDVIDYDIIVKYFVDFFNGKCDRVSYDLYEIAAIKEMKAAFVESDHTKPLYNFISKFMSKAKPDTTEFLGQLLARDALIIDEKTYINCNLNWRNYSIDVLISHVKYKIQKEEMLVKWFWGRIYQGRIDEETKNKLCSLVENVSRMLKEDYINWINTL